MIDFFGGEGVNSCLVVDSSQIDSSVGMKSMICAYLKDYVIFPFFLETWQKNRVGLEISISFELMRMRMGILEECLEHLQLLCW